MVENGPEPGKDKMCKVYTRKTSGHADRCQTSSDQKIHLSFILRELSKLFVRPFVITEFSVE